MTTHDLLNGSIDTILVPTDFSETAENALKYAASLALSFDAKIVLMHAFRMRHVGNTIMIDITDVLRKDAEADLQRQRKIVADLDLNIDVETHAVDHEFLNAIAVTEKQVSADLIVMGTTGASGLKGAFFGSNTQSILKHTTSPVLAVPPSYKFEGVNDVTIVTDLQPFSSDRPAAVINYFAKQFKAQSHFLTVDTATQKKQVEYAALASANDSQFEDIPHQYDLVTGQNVQEGVKDFLSRQNTQLLVVVPRKHTFIDKLFRKSVSRKLMLEPTIPLLVIND